MTDTLLLADTLSERRRGELDWYLDGMQRGASSVVTGLAAHPITVVGKTPTGPILSFTIFSEGIKRDGDEVIVAGGDLDEFKRSPRMLWSHDIKLEPVGRWIPESIRKFDDARLGPVIVGNARPLALDDGSEVARRSQRVFRMYELGDLDSVSGSWKPEQVDLIRNKQGRVTGLRHLKWQMLEASAVSMATDTEARARAWRFLVEDPELPDVDRNYFARSLEAVKLYRPAYMILDIPAEPASDATIATRMQRVADVMAGRASADVLTADAAPALERAAHALDGVHEAEDREMLGDTLRWNPQHARAFDIDRAQFEPASAEIGLVARYLDCEVKHLQSDTSFVPGVRMGAFLTGLDEVLADWSVDDVRNLHPHDGKESPIVHAMLQLNSTRRQSFLVHGARFMHERVGGEGRRFVCGVRPRYGGLSVDTYAHRDHREMAEAFIAKVWERAATHKFLKGEAFRLSGEFLARTDETWDDCFLSEENEGVLKRTLRGLIEHGGQMDNRGVMIAGPPGTGKSLVGRVLTNETRGVTTGTGDPITVIVVEARDFHYAGSFGGFSEAFALARENAPAWVRFEDVDNWMTARTVDLLKSEMDGAQQYRGIVTMLVSNHPEGMPEALIDRPGRFHEVLHVDLPDAAQRTKMVARWLPTLEPDAAAKAVAATDGYTGAHVREYAKYAETIAREEGLTLPDALARASEKLKQQRDLIDKLQSQGTAYRPRRELVPVFASVELRMTRRALERGVGAAAIVALNNNEKLDRFRVALAPVAAAVLRTGLVDRELLATAVATLAATDDLEEIELAVRSMVEQARRIHTLVQDLDDGAPPSTAHNRAGQVLAQRNRSKLEQARVLLQQIVTLLDTVLADGQPEEGGLPTETILADGRAFTITASSDAVRELLDRVEKLADREQADRILRELTQPTEETRLARAVAAYRPRIASLPNATAE